MNKNIFSTYDAWVEGTEQPKLSMGGRSKHKSRLCVYERPKLPTGGRTNTKLPMGGRSKHEVRLCVDERPKPPMGG